MNTARMHLQHILQALTLLCTVLLVGCNNVAVQDATTTPKSEAKPTRIVTTMAWEKIALPISDTQLSDYVTSPIEPQTIYACMKAHATGAEQMTLWRTRDAGQHWSQLHLSAATGAGCSLSIAPDQPQRIALLIKHDPTSQQPANAGSLYMSIDGGTSWHNINSSSALANEQIEDCSVTITAHHIYLWYSYGGGQGSLQHSLLERSDDNGHSWSHSDTAFGANSLFFMPQIGHDETLTTIVRHVAGANTTSSQLWISHDGGRSWQQQNDLPPQVMTYLQQSHSSSAPLYALAHEQLPSNLYRLQLWQSTSGQQWSTIPALPVTGTNAEQSGLLQALAITNNGQLLAFGVDPNSGIPARTSTQRPTTTFWLWAWNPGTAHWQVLSTPLQYTADEGCGLCWNGQFAGSAQQNSYLYAYHWGDQKHLFRFHLPEL
ncbi:hypothetical protein [Dictyobacter kobayashii]|uniref:Sialidase domain-containing protein n=1 Tax=Dictyobacter kobayashii TaxID=2014872 RepID=A0A402AY25_9CHLR|nr:hypothetical protein [Dictyobacter kobayashii]GCE24031.1 hypothetical protein KDK_78310 [Dictyobacter kobayashii]